MDAPLHPQKKLFLRGKELIPWEKEISFNRKINTGEIQAQDERN